MAYELLRGWVGSTFNHRLCPWGGGPAHGVSLWVQTPWATSSVSSGTVLGAALTVSTSSSRAQHRTLPGVGGGLVPVPGAGSGLHSCLPARTQRPYDIHSSNAVESLVQLFGTASVQYAPSWSKGTVALLRKVSLTHLPQHLQHGHWSSAHIIGPWARPLRADSWTGAGLAGLWAPLTLLCPL